MFRRCGFALLLLSLAPVSGLVAQHPTSIEIYIDMTDSGRRLAHVRETLPVQAGDNIFEYPQWIQGEHAPNGPIDAVTGVFFKADGKELKWRRDLVDMYAFHVEVPQGISSVELLFDFLAVPGLFQGTNVMAYEGLSSRIAMLELSNLVIYPAGVPVREIEATLSLRLPERWTYGTALRAEKDTGVDVTFRPTSLEEMVDSPIVMGSHCRHFPLAPEIKPEHTLNVCADTDEEAAVRPDVLDRMTRLVREASALYRAHHYSHYDFVLAISKYVQGDSLEHHQSADYRVADLDFSKPQTPFVADLIPHEYSHSWCGKYRRPIGLATPDYKTPLRDDLLWVYEGLNQYLGWVLSVRSGFMTQDQLVSMWAYRVSRLDTQAGRQWRNLQDTADASQILRGGDQAWFNWRRSQAYYDEGALVWLEADVRIRELTKGQKSLDDFAKEFLGQRESGWEVVPYDFDDVVHALNGVAAYDWASFWTKRLTEHQPHAPMAGLEGAGYRLVNKEEMSPMEASLLGKRGSTDMWASIGFTADPKGMIGDVRFDSLAYAAGLAPGDLIKMVQGKAFTAAGIRDVVREAKTSTQPIEVTAEREGETAMRTLDYHAGEKYPSIERVSGTPDVLTLILTPAAGVHP